MNPNDRTAATTTGSKGVAAVCRASRTVRDRHSRNVVRKTFTVAYSNLRQRLERASVPSGVTTTGAFKAAALSRREALPYGRHRIPSKSLQIGLRMLPSSGRQIDTKPEADPQQHRACPRVKWTRRLSSPFVVGLVTAAVLDLGFGVSFSSIARYVVPRWWCWA